jgi:hypothetical protein
MQVPKELPLMLGQGYDDTIKTILADPENHMLNISCLSTICKVKIKFTIPVTIYANRRHAIKDVTEYVFNGFFLKGDSICYRFKRGGRTGQYLPFQYVESYEPVRSTVDEFTSFEQFRKKFDTFFITEELIEQLWNEKSAQHGERYKPSDFRPVSKAGKEALRMFLPRFKGVNNTDTSTYSSRTYEGVISYYVEGRYYGRSNTCAFSRDVTVSHQMGFNRVFYCSEQTGGGREHNGLLVNRSTYLWLEDD